MILTSDRDVSRGTSLDIDWQRVVLNIRQAGMPVSQLAARIGMDDQTLRNYARGDSRNPRWLQAVALLDVHSDVCSQKHRLEDLRA